MDDPTTWLQFAKEGPLYFAIVVLTGLLIKGELRTDKLRDAFGKSLDNAVMALESLKTAVAACTEAVKDNGRKLDDVESKVDTIKTSRTRTS